MPSLNEYISTLRKYNPGITDRSITVYLLKDGWEIEKIEKAFKELGTTKPDVAPVESTRTFGSVPASIPNTMSAPVKTVSEATSQPLATPQPVTAASLIASNAPLSSADILKSLASNADPLPAPEDTRTTQPIAALATNIPLKSESIPVDTIHHDLEIQPVEVEGAISHPSFSDIVNKKSAQVDAIATPVGMTGGTESIGTYPSVSPVMPSSILAPNTPTPHIQKSSLQEQMEALVLEREHAIPVVSAKPVPVVEEPVKPATFAYMSDSRPKFSYDEIMNGVNSPITSNPTPAYDPLNDVTKAVSSMSPVPQSDVAETKDPSVSYVGGSIVSGQGGSFGFSPSPTINSTPASYGGVGNMGTPSITDAQRKALEQIQSGLPVNISNANPTSSTSGSKSKVGKKIAWIIVTLLVLAGLVFGFMKYVYGVYLFASAPIDKDHFLTGFVKSVADMKTAEYSAQITLGASEKTPDVEILDLAKLAKLKEDARQAKIQKTADSIGKSYENDTDMIDSSSQGIDEMLRIIPNDASVTGGVSGIYDRTTSSKDLKLAINGAYNGDGISVSVDLESVKVADTVFLRLNKFPSFFIDLSSVKDKWIALTKEDLIDSGFASFFGIEKEVSGSKNTDVVDSNADALKKQLGIILEIADTNKVFEVVGDPVRQKKADDRVVYEYHVTPNLDNFITFAQQASTRLKTDFGDKALINLSDTDIADLKGEAFAYYFNYLKANTQVYIGIDTKGHPAYIHTVSKVALKGDTLTKQLNSDFKINFNRINETIKVEAPTESIPYIDAYSKVTGKTKENILLERQSGAVISIQNAITKYVQWTGQTPVLLTDLQKTSAELALASTTFKAMDTNDKDYYSSAYYFYYATSTRPLYSGSIKDAYSGAPIAYQRIGTQSYTLTYQMQLPTIPKDSYDLYSFTSYAVGSGSKREASPLMYLSFVNGTNTGDEKFVSREADALSKKDSDKDKLSDSLEAYLGTNPNKADTDSDGTNDYNEVRQGSNPKGAGTWAAMLETASR